MARIRSILEPTGIQLFRLPKDRTTSKGEFDLLLYCKHEKVGISCQLKRSFEPLWPKHYKTVADNINKANLQCERASEWLKKCPKQVQDMLNLSPKKLSEVNFLPLIISSYSLGNGFANYQEGFPVVNEFMLRNICRDTMSVRQLWDACRDAYLNWLKYPAPVGYHDSMPLDIGGFDFHFLA